MADARTVHLASVRDSIAKLPTVPNHLRGGLQRYLEDGIEPGGFLKACVENDLANAITRSTDQTRDDVDAVVKFLLFYVPATAWGSKERRIAWQLRARDSLGGDDG